jgi:CheY-like chemotaxis protein/DNA-binding CsgD family transcriptional regulator
MPTNNILIVDDSAESILIIEKAIEISGLCFNKTTANNGIQALNAITDCKPHLIITDWDMPEMNGIEFISKVRELPEYSKTPIIVITGMMVRSGDLKMAFEKGATDFLRKPFDKTELVARINSMLLLSNYMKDLEESKKRELASSALRLTQMNEMNNRLLEDLNDLYPFLDTKGKEKVNQIVTKYKIHSSDSIWKEFETRFENVYEEFYNSLAHKHEALTPNEKKICAFLKMGLNSKDIAALTFQDAKSVDMARYRLRKKMGLSPDENLTEYLSKI